MYFFIVIFVGAAHFFLRLQRQQLIDSCIHAQNARARMYSQMLELNGNSSRLPHTGSRIRKLIFVSNASLRKHKMDILKQKGAAYNCCLQIEALPIQRCLESTLKVPAIITPIQRNTLFYSSVDKLKTRYTAKSPTLYFLHYTYIDFK